jgi:hypothetical protein
MKKVEYQKLEFNETKFPHLLTMKQRVDELTLYIEKLNLRKVLITSKNAVKSQYDQNEDEILLIRTDWELAKSHKDLAEKTEYVKNFTEKLVTYIDEVNENFETMRSKALSYYENNKKSKNNETVKALELEFEAIKDTDLDENWEVRIKHYIVLRTIFENQKKPK